MTTTTINKNSRLLAALREAVELVQMVVFKEIRANLAKKKTGAESSSLASLAGAVTNEIFGTQNPEDKFVRFRAKHLGDIEQELLAIKDELPQLCPDITDALRIQTLCDHQEGNDSSHTLVQAKEFGFLLEEREVPLPSSFMLLARTLGEKHAIIIAPAQFSPEQDSTTVH